MLFLSCYEAINIHYYDDIIVKPNFILLTAIAENTIGI